MPLSPSSELRVQEDGYIVKCGLPCCTYGLKVPQVLTLGESARAAGWQESSAQDTGPAARRRLVGFGPAGPTTRLHHARPPTPRPRSQECLCVHVASAFPFKDPVKGPICAVCCVQCVPNAGCMKPAFSNQEMARV